MDESVAKAMERIVGPLVAGGLSLGIADGVARIRAFEAGEYAGERCEECGVECAVLDPWRGCGSKTTRRLCHRCGDAFHREMLREDAKVKMMPRSQGACHTCGFHGAIYGVLCWPCAHRDVRGEAKARTYEYRDRTIEDDRLPSSDR